MFNTLITFTLLHWTRLTTKPTKWHVYPVKTQINLGIRPVWSESTLSTWGRMKSLERTAKPLIRLGAKVILLVLSWGGSFYFVSLASTMLISANSRRFISWNSPRRRGFLCIRAHVYLRLLCHTADVLFPETLRESEGFYVSVHVYVSVYYVILQTSSNTFIFHNGLRVSLFFSLLVGRTGDVRLKSLMVKGYTSTRLIHENIWEHIQCQIEETSSPRG